MANPWFRMYSEFATDPKVQMMTEEMQRRLVMLFCLRCGDVTVTLSDEELAFQLRVSDEELAKTKSIFLRKGFITDDWDITNWDKRQFASDSSAARTRSYRERKKQEQKVTVTSQKRPSDALDTDTDTDTEKKPTASAVVGSEPASSKQPTDDSPVFISIPTNKFNTTGEERPITHQKINEWQATYPGVDVTKTIIRIRSWVINNPNKRKTFNGIFRFIDTWLAKEQNNGGSHGANQFTSVAGSGAAKMPHADVVRGQAQRALERINGGHGLGPIREDGSIVSEQGQVGRVGNLP